MTYAEPMNTHTRSTVVNLIWLLVAQVWISFDVYGAMCEGTSQVELKFMLDHLLPTFSLLNLIPLSTFLNITQLMDQSHG